MIPRLLTSLCTLAAFAFLSACESLPGESRDPTRSELFTLPGWGPHPTHHGNRGMR